MSELKITQEKVTAAFSEANDCPKAISIMQYHRRDKA